MTEPARKPLAAGPVAIAAAVVAVLISTAGRYGYHRDELYFLRAGRDLAWGYPDQPPVTPAIARAAAELAPDSLLLLRTPAALAVGAIVLLAALTARALGGDRQAQTLAALCTASGTIFLITGHLLSTTTFDLLVWAALTLLFVIVLKGGDPRLWLVTGAVAGVGLLNKQLVAFLLLAVLGGLLLVGPREVLRSGWAWSGAVIALAIWSPHLLWQAEEGWPALKVAAAVANGGSVSSEPPIMFLPFQLVLISPFLVPIWMAGLVRLWRDPRLRSLTLAYLLLALVFQFTGGKPYYLAGMYPLLLAAGAVPVVVWIRRARFRLAAVAAALAVSAGLGAMLGLPLLPADRVAGSAVLALNEDVGETIGWPELVQTIAQAHQEAGGEALILTSNYGQAGAVDRYGPQQGLPRAYSGHNGYGYWGPPAERNLPVVAVGFTLSDLNRWFRQCQLQARIDNKLGVQNEEQGQPVHVCTERRQSWSQLWPQIRRLG